MANIIQPDNAVIDYTTISVMIDALNTQQKYIDDLWQAVKGTSITQNPDGTTATQTGVRKFQSGYVPITSANSKNVPVKYSFTSKPESVVAVVQSANGVPAYAYINKTITATEADFTIVASKITSGMNLYWIATGY